MSATLAQVDAWSKAQTRDFNQLCQAYEFQLCAKFGSAPVVYPSAHAAYLASGAKWGTDMDHAPVGAVAFLKLGTADHVMWSRGDGTWEMGSAHAHTWTNAKAHIGHSTYSQYHAATGAVAYGWYHTDGKNSATITAAAPAPKPTATQRVAVAAGVHGRDKATTASSIEGGYSGGAVVTMKGYVVGAKATSGKISSTTWFVGPDDNYYSAVGFTSQSTTGLKNLTPAPPVVTPPVVTPPVTTLPVTTPVTPDPPVVTPPTEPTEPPTTEPSEPVTPADPEPPVTSPANPTEPTAPTTPATPPSTTAPVSGWVGGVIAIVGVAVTALLGWLFSR